MKKLFKIIVSIFGFRETGKTNSLSLKVRIKRFIKKERISVIDFFQIEQPPKSLPPVSITCLKHEGMIPKDLLERGYTFTDLRNHYSLPEIIDSLGKNAIKALINEGCSFQDFINAGVNSWHVIDYFGLKNLKSQEQTLMIVLRDFYAENSTMNGSAFEKLLKKGYDLLSLGEEIEGIKPRSSISPGLYIGEVYPKNGLELFHMIKERMIELHLSEYILSFCSYIKHFSSEEVKNVCDKEPQCEYYFRADKVNYIVNDVINDDIFNRLMSLLRDVEIQNMKTGNELKELFSLEALITAGVPPKSLLKEEEIKTGADYSLASEIAWDTGIERRIQRLFTKRPKFCWSDSVLNKFGIRYDYSMTKKQKDDFLYHQLCDDGYPAKTLLKKGFAKGVYFNYARQSSKVALDLGMTFSDFCRALDHIERSYGFVPNPIIHNLFYEFRAIGSLYSLGQSVWKEHPSNYIETKHYYLSRLSSFCAGNGLRFEDISSRDHLYFPERISVEYGEEKLKERGFPDKEINYFFLFSKALIQEIKTGHMADEEREEQEALYWKREKRRDHEEFQDLERQLGRIRWRAENQEELIVKRVPKWRDGRIVSYTEKIMRSEDYK